MLVVALVAAALVAASSAWPSEDFQPTEAYLQGERNLSLHAYSGFIFMNRRDGLQRQ